MPKLPVERATSAGGVVLRSAGGVIEVLLCTRLKRGIWALPKGTPYHDENIIETARREVREETGLEVEIRTKIGSINYWFKQDNVCCNKKVHYFMMEPRGGSLDQHDPEFDEVEWVSLKEAYKRMSYENEIKMVSQAVELFCGK